jgi:hypothetical protein
MLTGLKCSPSFWFSNQNEFLISPMRATLPNQFTLMQPLITRNTKR